MNPRRPDPEELSEDDRDALLKDHDEPITGPSDSSDSAADSIGLGREDDTRPTALPALHAHHRGADFFDRADDCCRVGVQEVLIVGAANHRVRRHGPIVAARGSVRIA